MVKSQGVGSNWEGVMTALCAYAIIITQEKKEEKVGRNVPIKIPGE